VGVDIGCGMAAVETNLTSHDLPDSLALLRHRVEQAIPVGFNEHEQVNKYAEKLALWKGFHDLTDKVQDRLGKARKQMGTLGGGNHFIELCLDTADKERWASSPARWARAPTSSAAVVTRSSFTRRHTARADA
jgi:tRNA-splicing ligase RtcB